MPPPLVIEGIKFYVRPFQSLHFTTFYWCLINHLHTSCSCLHNNYKCIQFDHAKEFFLFSFNYQQQCGTIYVINKKHKKMSVLCPCLI